MENQAIATNVRGWNMSIAQLFGSGPKITMNCGKCGITFQKRVPVVSNPRVECPHCRTINVVPLMT